MKYFLFFLGVGVTIFSILGFGFMIGYEHGRNDGCPYEGLECPQAKLFQKGDTLYPSYACPDTLIVVNASGLNYGLANCDGTDWGIDSVLHENCNRLDGRKSIVLNDGYGYDYLTPAEIDSISKLYSLNDNR